MYTYQNTVINLNLYQILMIIIIFAITLIIILSPIFIITYLKNINRKISKIENILLEQNNILLNILNKNEQKKED